MNERQKKLADKVGRLTQRLETAIYDPALSAERNAQVAAELRAISGQLHSIIPGLTFSPEQRLERIALAVNGGTSNPLEPDSQRLARLKTRIDELIPGSDMTIEAKVDKLAELFRKASGQKIRDVA